MNEWIVNWNICATSFQTLCSCIWCLKYHYWAESRKEKANKQTNKQTIVFLTLRLEIQSGGLYLPPFWREWVMSFLTSCQVRLKSNSTRRGPTRPGGVSGQGPKVVCPGVTALPVVVWALLCSSVLFFQKLSTCCCGASKSQSFCLGDKYDNVPVLLKDRRKKHPARVKTRDRAKTLLSFFSIFPLLDDERCSLNGSGIGLTPAFPTASLTHPHYKSCSTGSHASSSTSSTRVGLVLIINDVLVLEDIPPTDLMKQLETLIFQAYPLVLVSEQLLFF